MKKRGSIVFKFVYGMILSAIILLSFIHIAKVYGTGEIYHQQGLVKDISFLISTLSSYQGDFLIEYRCKCEDYVIDINSEKISLLEKKISNQESVAASFDIIKSKMILPTVRFEQPETIIFEKKGDILFISEK